jgi:alkane 1-monooxygenase
MPVIARYAIATLTPLTLLILGALAWGGFAVAALVWLTLLAALVDWMLEPPGKAEGAGPLGERLPVILGLGHLALIPVVLYGLSVPGLEPLQKLALFFAAASFVGQVSHPNAHELIHRRARGERWLGAAVYVSVGFGHHVSAHRLVHHAHVGTWRDPNTPLPGESFWSYLPRAWAEEFRAGLIAEEGRLERRGLGPRHWRNPYWAWIGGEALCLVLVAWVFGPVALLAHLALWLLSGAQVLMSDYLQHYGLQRMELPSGRLEPVGPHHSWDAPRGFSSYLMMNAPAHSEHHLHPDRTFDTLGPGAEAPRLPYAMPVMAVLATVPMVWHRVMDRRALKVMEAAEARVAARTVEDGDAAEDEDRPEDSAAHSDAPAPLIADAPQRKHENGPSAPAAMPEEDAELIARVQSLVGEDDLAPDTPDDAGQTLRLRRPVRSGRRAAE